MERQECGPGFLEGDAIVLIDIQTAAEDAEGFRGQGKGTGRTRRVGGGLAGIGGDSDVFQITDHHFLLGLVTPADGFGGVGIVGILRTVVEPGGRFNAAAGPDDHGFSGAVLELPVEVVGGDVEQFAALAVGVHEVVAEGFATHVHVGHEGEDLRIEWHRQGAFYFMIGSPRRNTEAGLFGGGDMHFVGRGCGGESQAEPGAVFGGSAIGRVVELEDEAGAGGELFGVAGRVGHGAAAGDVGREKVVAIGDPFAARTRGEDQDMVDLGERGGADFEASDPAVFGKAGGDFPVLISHAARGFDGHRSGQFDNGIRGAHDPLLRPGERLRSLGGIACGTVAGEPCEQGGAVGFGERPVIGPGDGVRPGLRRGKPRRHDPLGDHLFDHGGMARDVLHVHHFKGAGAAGPVAFLTIPLDDAGDFPVPGEGGHGGRLRRGNLQRTTRGRGAGETGTLPLGEGREGLGQIMPGGRVLLITNAILVIHRPAVVQGAGPVEDENFRGADRAQSLQQRLFDIRRAEAIPAVGFGKGGEGFRRIGLDGSGKKETDALGLPFVFQGREGGREFLAERTGRAGDGNHGEGTLRHDRGKGPGGPGKVIEPGLLDHAPDAGFGGGAGLRGFGCGRPAKRQQTQATDEKNGEFHEGESDSARQTRSGHGQLHRMAGNRPPQATGKGWCFPA